MNIETFKKNVWHDGAHVNLQSAISFCPANKIDFWQMQNIDAISKYFFGMTCQEFFEKTAKNDGLTISNADFRQFLQCENQIFDGTIIACGKEIPIFILEYFDSSEMILAVQDVGLIKNLYSVGWEKCVYPPYFRGYPEWAKILKPDDRGW